jgi:2-keto-4-pentenoate hydratase/2-oxohepta-3-ene-1,7-dioic acid hydratase in catechol pathway
MLLYRLAPDGRYAAGYRGDRPRLLASDPWTTAVGSWRWGRELDTTEPPLLAPVVPGKIVGIGRNYRDHAAELGNPMPEEPLLFLKAPSSVIGPGEPVLLPPESGQVDFEGELALVIGRRIHRVDERRARAAIFGFTCACDVTARDLQHRDRTFARAKSFDTFCPLGPALRMGADMEGCEVVTRINGEERQRGSVAQMAWGPATLVRYVSRFMTLEPGDVLLTGTPAGVGSLAPGDRLEVEIAVVGTLAHPVASEAER